MTEFTPLGSGVGGILIGLAALLLLALNGRIAGISGIVGGLLTTTSGDRPWRVAFVGGLLVGGWVAFQLVPGHFGTSGATPTAWLVVAGLLVGVGTRMGGGCTSGHGVSGLSRLSPRSMVATTLFMLAAAVTVFVTHHL